MKLRSQVVEAVAYDCRDERLKHPYIKKENNTPDTEASVTPVAPQRNI